MHHLASRKQGVPQPPRLEEHFPLIPTPCYAWNNTYNRAKLNMTLRRWPDPARRERQAEIVKEGRDFFNEEPPAEYYKPYVYPHTIQAFGRR